MPYSEYYKTCDETYALTDCVTHSAACKRIRDVNIKNPCHKSDARGQKRSIAIKKVKFNPPATVVFWSDGVKTVVKDKKLEDAKSFVVDSENDKITYVDASTGIPLIQSMSLRQWKEEGLTYALVKRVIPLHQKILKTWC